MAEAKPTRGQWFFEASEGRLRLVDPTGSEQVFSPADVPKKVDLAVMLLGRPLWRTWSTGDR